MGLFNILQVLKKNCTLEILVDQAITVMQDLDAAELETNAKLAGFSSVQQKKYERWVKEGEKDKLISTIKLTILRQKK